MKVPPPQVDPMRLRHMQNRAPKISEDVRLLDRELSDLITTLLAGHEDCETEVNSSVTESDND